MQLSLRKQIPGTFFFLRFFHRRAGILSPPAFGIKKPHVTYRSSVTFTVDPHTYIVSIDTHIPMWLSIFLALILGLLGFLCGASGPVPMRVSWGVVSPTECGRCPRLTEWSDPAICACPGWQGFSVDSGPQRYSASLSTPEPLRLNSSDSFGSWFGCVVGYTS
jgi:hypothetical protein